jgi:hypothetical protein
MIAPRFNLRTLLAALTVGSVVFLVAGMAVRGQMWAWAITISVFSLAIAALTHAAWFGVIWMFAKLPTTQTLATSSPMPQTATRLSSSSNVHVDGREAAAPATNQLPGN